MRPHRVMSVVLAFTPREATSAAQLVLLGGLTRTLIPRRPAHCVDPGHSQQEATRRVRCVRLVELTWTLTLRVLVSCVERDSIRRLWRLYVLTVLLEERILTAIRRQRVFCAWKVSTPHRSLLSV